MTELDLTVLGVLARDGPMSAYDVRQVFARSVTPSWSSSSGSIYPAIRRLVEAGLASASAAEGARGRQTLQTTPEGRRAVEQWVCDFAPGLAGATPDPLRTRAFFLALLTTEARQAFLRHAMESTDGAIVDAERIFAELSARHDGSLDHLASLGALYELRARRAWLADVSRRLSPRPG